MPEKDRIFFSEFYAALREQGAKKGLAYIYPHVNADGDALGSALALAAVAHHLGLEAYVLTDEEVPDKLSFLSGASEYVKVYRAENMDQADPSCRKYILDKQSMGIVIDCPGGTRISNRLELFESAPRRFVIDHHLSDLISGADRLIDTEAAACCEIITDFILYVDRQEGLTSAKKIMSADLAVCLMTGLLTDTGRFSYSNTSAKTFRMAAELMAWPFDLRALSHLLFDSISRARLLLSGYINTHASYHYNKRMIFTRMPFDVYLESGAVDTDFDGMASHLRDVIGVELAVLLKEEENGGYRASVRSDKRINASNYAASFGGGGHARASGFTLPAMAAAEAERLCVEGAKDFFS